MASNDPRRSSRGRNAQGQLQHSPSLARASRRFERNTRSLAAKTESPKKSDSASVSSDSLEEAAGGERPATRQRKRGGDSNDNKGSPSKRSPERMASVEMEDNEVRCICGEEDYPGPPPFSRDGKLSRDIDAQPISAGEMTADTAGLFVQCETCKVWQHGACFGITDQQSAKETEYFCEQCKPNLHKLFTASNGQRYSSYAPMRRSLRASLKAREANKSPPEPSKIGRASSTTQTAKRRSTLNSRYSGEEGFDKIFSGESAKSPSEIGKSGRATTYAQAGKGRSTKNSRYNEDEQLRLAIEASKEDAPPEQVELQPPSAKRFKRSRADDELELRQRKSPEPESPFPGSSSKSAHDADESQDVVNTRNASAGKKARVSSGRQQRDKPEHDEREDQKSKAPKRRTARSDRRRGADVGLDEPPPPTGTSTAASPAHASPVSVPPPVEVADLSNPAANAGGASPASGMVPTCGSHSKPARTVNKKGKGRSQNIEDRAVVDEGTSSAQPREEGRHGDDMSSAQGHSKSADQTKVLQGLKAGKSSSHPPRTLPQMWDRTEEILEFIKKNEVAKEPKKCDDKDAPDLEQTRVDDNDRSNERVQDNVTDPLGSGLSARNEGPLPRIAVESAVAMGEEDFKKLPTQQMLHVLKVKVEKWRKDFSKYLPSS